MLSFQEIVSLGIVAFGLVVFVLLATAFELGFRLGLRRFARRPALSEELAGISTLTAGMLGFVAFILALSISFSQDRFETRRHTTLSEANTIGTAWWRTGLAGTEGQTVAVLIADYAQTRLAYIQAETLDEQQATLARTNALQSQIWRHALSLVNDMQAPLAASLVASLNDMFDASLVQRYALESRVPMETSFILLGGALLTVGALGYQMGLGGRRPLAMAVVLLLMLDGGMMLVVDMSQPRLGFTRVDPLPLIWTIQGFAPAPK
jgi:hypothetical protein